MANWSRLGERRVCLGLTQCHILGCPGNRLWDRIQHAGCLFRRALGIHICKREGTGAGVGRGRNQATMQAQRQSWPTLQGALVLSWPTRDVPSCTEMDRYSDRTAKLIRHWMWATLAGLGRGQGGSLQLKQYLKCLYAHRTSSSCRDKAFSERHLQ